VLILITPGRALRWAPRWSCSDDAVLFDASSGDYWVLSAEGRTVIEWLQAEPVIDRSELLERLAPTTADAATLIDNLGTAGLLMAKVDGVAFRLPAHAES
jgi:hypothetical protein